MPIRPGEHTVDPAHGTLEVRTYREGMAQKIGHDLIIEVRDWSATVNVAEDGTVTAVALDADPGSLHAREGLHGVKPLSDTDGAEIRKNIDAKVLGRQPIEFRSTTLEAGDGRLLVEGELTLAGATRSATFDLAVAANGHVSGTLAVTQSEWGIKPYRGLMGALKVRDEVEIVLDAPLPAT
jgi:polyisoprenoid-binding protein YceI